MKAIKFGGSLFYQITPEIKDAVQKFLFMYTALNKGKPLTDEQIVSFLTRSHYSLTSRDDTGETWVEMDGPFLGDGCICVTTQNEGYIGLNLESVKRLADLCNSILVACSDPEVYTTEGRRL